MDLNENNIQELDAHRIMELLKDDLDKIYNSYSYVNIKREEYMEIVLQEIENSKKAYNGNVKYSEYLSKKIKLKIAEILKNKLNSPESSLQIISNYIEFIFNNVNLKYDNAVKLLKQLSNFLEKYNFIPNPNLIIDLMNSNATFYKIVEIVYNKNKDKIIKGNLSELFNNDIIDSFIEIYCMLNNIEIDYSYDEKEIIDSNSSDALRNYLNEIGRYPLLTIEQERAMAIRINNGDNNVREKFINSNLKLVVSVAKRYKNRSVNFMDLIAYGNIGLIEAVDKYDINKGFRFSTYAIHWIKREILVGIKESSRNITISNYQLNKIKKYKKAVELLEAKLNRKPEIKEIAFEMGLDVAKVSEIEILCSDTVSLNEMVGEDADNELEDIVPTSLTNLEDEIIDESLPEIVKSLFETANLTKNEKTVIIYRFGFNKDKRLTLEMIGKILGVTRERVRQIEAKALRKLRNTSNISELAVYMDYPDQALDNIKEYKEKYGNSGKTNKTFLKTYTRKEISKEEPKEVPAVSEEHEIITKDDYKKLMNMLELHNFKSLRTIFNIREITILMLSLGFIDGKKFTCSAIAKFLYLDEREVIGVIRSILTTYRDYFNKLLLEINEQEEITEKR